MSGLMRGGWKRSLVSGPQRLRSSAWTAPDHQKPPRQPSTLPRCRPYEKNDQAHVEQKNWSVVRQLIGYDRYEGPAAQAQMERVYEVVRVYVNAYQPLMKLIGKERVGEKVRKRYDVPSTPYRRAMEAGVMLPEAQAWFESQVQAHGPMALRRRLDAELDRLWSLRVGSPSMAKATA